MNNTSQIFFITILNFHMISFIQFLVSSIICNLEMKVEHIT